MSRSLRSNLRVIQLLAVMAGMALVGSALVLPGVLSAGAAVDSVEEQVIRDVPPLPEDLDPLPETSHMTATDGSRLAELHGGIDRVSVPLDEVPQITRQAVIATEDADFYRHQGVDHHAMVRAAITNVREGRIEEGASTLTQQYVRNVLLDAEETLERKINEALWAIELEDRLSKDEILERYLNTVYLGHGVYGIGTAAAFYFSKPVSELDAVESALLAGMIRSPSRNDPVEKPDRARARRDIVLGQMEINGYLTEDEEQAARRRPLGLEISEDPPLRFPFFVEWVKRIAFDPAITLQPGVQEVLGETPEERRRTVFEGGITIETTLDPILTQLAEGTLDGYLQQPAEDPMGSLVTLSPGSGAIRAMTIGPEAFGECPDPEETCDVTKLNPVVPGGGGSGRQPGSAFKPIVAAAALDAGYTAGTEYETPSGEEIEGCGTSEPYDPENYSGRSQGIVDMYEAVEGSVNVYFAKLARDVGPAQVADMARKLGIEHSPNMERLTGPKSCSIGLGTADVFPLEMASVYATFANQGVRCAPFAIDRITDRHGEVLYEHENSCSRVLAHEDAIRLIDVLEGPPSSGGTAPYVGATLDRPVAGKTGTTTGWVDAWFSGFVPQYASIAWVGFEQPESMFGIEAGGTVWDRVTGGTIPARMWADYMAQALSEVPAHPFPEVEPVPEISVPWVVGRSQGRATAILEDAGFRTEVDVVTDHRPAGRVLDQSPSGSAPEGSVVILRVSNGEGAPPPPPEPEPTEPEPTEQEPTEQDGEDGDGGDEDGGGDGGDGGDGDGGD